MKRVDKDRAPLFRDRAESFLRAMQVAAEHDPEFKEVRSGVALLAIHSAISLGDAILICCQGERSDGDHRAAAKELRGLCGRRQMKELGGIQDFRFLLGQKNDVAYGDRRCGADDAKNMMRRAQSFATWTYTNFKELARKGNPDATEQSPP